ncbi:hypothetical protein NKH18_35440 [Streptomyces sp. M10(2022)]
MPVQEGPVSPSPGTPAEPPAPQEAACVPAVPQQRSTTADPAQDAAPSPAYLVLARIGRLEPRLALSDGDCAVLERLAAEWFIRGMDADYLTQALISGLPAQIGSPVGFVRRRLIDKLPPRVPAAPPGAGRAGPAPAPRGVRGMRPSRPGRRAPGRPLPPLPRRCPGGVRGAGDPAAQLPGGRDVHALVGSIRNLMRAP